MDYTDDIKTMILDGKSAFEVGNYALQKGMIDLERDGIFKLSMDKQHLKNFTDL